MPEHARPVVLGAEQHGTASIYGAGIRHHARVRRSARTRLEGVHRAGTHEGMVGPEGLHGAALEDGPASRGNLPLRHARS